MYVCAERGSRKTRRLVVKDKSADALHLCKKHILSYTERCVNAGKENTYFKTLDAIIDLHEIPGPIHVDPHDRRKHAQSVKRSHSTVKMRLRLGRGLHRHNLQAVLDFEDFIHNRTDGSAADVFKKLGDAARLTCPMLNVTLIGYLTWLIPYLMMM